MHWPKWLYEALPWIYILIGILGLYFSNGSTIALMFALALLWAAIYIKQLRFDYRFKAHGKEILAKERERLRQRGEYVVDSTKADTLPRRR
jgi:hypothetical protein